MPELTQQERLQPALLDRLTDKEPEATQESRNQRVLSVRELRECVLRDLVWLLNTENWGNAEALAQYPAVASSVLNYGMPSLTGYTSNDIDVRRLERQLRQAIVDFEPRIIASSVSVRIQVDAERMNQNALVFEIEGELWADPMPIHLFMQTEVDLETGSVRLNESRGPD